MSRLARVRERVGAVRGVTAIQASPTGKALAPPMSMLHRIGNRALVGVLQRKLTVNPPGDRYEQEADRVADQVMQMPVAALAPAPVDGAPTLQRCACGGCCTACRHEEVDQPSLQREAADAGGTGTAPPVVHQVLNRPGERLDPETRRFMEPRLGVDLGEVRIHRDGLAAESARVVTAHAYTVGPHIVFAAGRYAPATAAGRHLLAHELTHVMQQGDASTAAGILQRACDTAKLAGRTEPVFFPKELRIMKVFGGVESLAKNSPAKIAVGLVQQALADLGHSPGTGGRNRDGVDQGFKGGTEGAVKSFQTSAGLPDTGAVDKNTLRCLDEERSKRIVPATATALVPPDLLLEGEPGAPGRDEEIFFDRGIKVLDGKDKAKLGRVATAKKGKKLRLIGHESEDEVVDFGTTLAQQRAAAVSAGLDAAGHKKVDHTLDPQPLASAKVLSYRDRRKVEIVQAGGTAATRNCALVPTGWTDPDRGPCDAADDPKVTDAIGKALPLLDTTISALKVGNAAAEAAVKDRFGSKAHLSRVKANLKKLRDHLNVQVRAKHLCANDCHGPCEGTEAYNNETHASSVTTLCASFLGSGRTPEGRAMTLIHEGAHGAFDTSDVAYDTTRLLLRLRTRPGLALINTDSYVTLVECLSKASCALPPVIDTFTGLSVPQKDAAEDALAWIERWMDWAWQDVNGAYGSLTKAKETGKWKTKELYYQGVLERIARVFGLHRPSPGSLATFREGTAVAALHDRFQAMMEVSGRSTIRKVELDTSVGANNEWLEGPARLRITPAFFTLPAPRLRNQVRKLLALLVHSRRDIRIDMEAQYAKFVEATVKEGWFDEP